MDARRGAGDGGALLVPQADLDTAESCHELERQLQGVLADGAPTIVIDASRVNRVSGAGLRVLLRTARRLRRAGGDLVLCRLTRTVRQALALSALGGEFSVVATLQQALEMAAALARAQQQAAAGPASLEAALGRCAAAVLEALGAAAPADKMPEARPPAGAQAASLEALADVILTAVERGRLARAQPLAPSLGP